MAVTSSSSAKTGARRRLSRRWRDSLTGYLFVLPAVAVISVFGLFPIAYSVYMSLYSWRVRQGSFIGLRNYHDLIGSWSGGVMFLVGLLAILVAHWLWVDAFKGSRRRAVARISTALALIAAGILLTLGWSTMLKLGDAGYLKSYVVTLYYAIGTVPLEIIISLFIAWLLYQKIRGQEMFRMIYFLPYVMPLVATSVVFQVIFNTRATGLANQVLGLVGIAPQKWLFEPRPITQLLFGVHLPGFWAGPSLALITIIIYGIWTYLGFNIVIFLAGLGGIPKELYEAAQIDGANSRQSFFNITLPMLSPVTFYLTLIGFIGTFQALTHIYVMQTPFAQNTVDTASVIIFNTFYQANNYGKAAAQSILLFVLLLVLTLAQQRIFGRRVFYG
jgi:multiple sugar transport system permease protein